ncbi:ParB/RepB/Spo0J family partition protein [candidate division KSB1 bacterium]|nr:ParB/RepB/Spo0J family partition protein [candidate division KSB1 bacterium]
MAVNRLGKGLRALIPEDAPEEEKQRLETMRELEVARINPNPFQPRQEFDEDALDELKQSIAEKGVIQPITVRRFGNGYQLIAGERRLRAVSSLGLEYIPGYVLDVESDEDMLELSLIENIQREDLNPIDIAMGYKRLLTECSLTQEQVAQKVGKDRTTVTNFLRLLKLPNEIQSSLVRKEINMGHARAIITVDEKDLQLEIWKKLLKNNLSVRKVENLVRQVKNKTTEKKPSEKKEKPFYLLEAENRLQEVLGTKVSINQSGKKGGKIEIEFYSEEELDRIIEIMYED